MEYVRGGGGISSRGSHVWGNLKDVLWKTLMGYKVHSCYIFSGFCSIYHNLATYELGELITEAV